MPFPNYQETYHVWASSGVSENPGASKIQEGWTRERPPFEWENWWHKRVDELLFEFNRGKSRGGAFYPGAGSTSDGPFNEDVTTEFNRGVISAENCRAMAANGVIVASRNVRNDNGHNYTLTMGHSSSGNPSANNITIQLRAQGGHIFCTGNVSAGGNLMVEGAGSFVGDVSGERDGSFERNLFAGGRLDVEGNSAVSGNLDVSGRVLVEGNASVLGDLTGWGRISSNTWIGAQLGMYVGDEGNVVYHRGSFQAFMRSFLGTANVQDARSSLDIKRQTFSRDNPSSTISNVNVICQKIGNFVVARVRVRFTSAVGSNITISNVITDPEFRVASSFNDSCGVLGEEGAGTQARYSAQARVMSNGSIQFSRYGVPNEDRGFSGTLSWPT